MAIPTHFEENFEILISFDKKKDGRNFTVSFFPEKGEGETLLRRMTLKQLATIYGSFHALLPLVVEKARSQKDIENILEAIP